MDFLERISYGFAIAVIIIIIFIILMIFLPSPKCFYDINTIPELNIFDNKQYTLLHELNEIKADKRRWVFYPGKDWKVKEGDKAELDKMTKTNNSFYMGESESDIEVTTDDSDEDFDHSYKKLDNNSENSDNNDENLDNNAEKSDNQDLEKSKNQDLENPDNKDLEKSDTQVKKFSTFGNYKNRPKKKVRFSYNPSLRTDKTAEEIKYDSINTRFKIYPLKFFDKWSTKRLKKCPNISTMLEKINKTREIKFAAIALLDKNAILKAHRGWAHLVNKTLRCCMPIVSHSKNTDVSGVWVENTIKPFISNEWIIFDYSKNMSMFNKTDSCYMILLDIQKDSSMPDGISEIPMPPNLSTFIKYL